MVKRSVSIKKRNPPPLRRSLQKFARTDTGRQIKQPAPTKRLNNSVWHLNCRCGKTFQTYNALQKHVKRSQQSGRNQDCATDLKRGAPKVVNNPLKDESWTRKQYFREYRKNKREERKNMRNIPKVWDGNGSATLEEELVRKFQVIFRSAKYIERIQSLLPFERHEIKIHSDIKENCYLLQYQHHQCLMKKTAAWAAQQVWQEHPFNYFQPDYFLPQFTITMPRQRFAAFQNGLNEQRGEEQWDREEMDRQWDPVGYQLRKDLDCDYKGLMCAAQKMTNSRNKKKEIQTFFESVSDDEDREAKVLARYQDLIKKFRQKYGKHSV